MIIKQLLPRPPFGTYNLMFANYSGVKKMRKNMKQLAQKNFFKGNLRGTGFATIPTTQPMHRYTISSHLSRDWKHFKLLE